MEAAAAYVDTFDLRRRRSLHLTYYRHGDTRERGMALTALVDAYRVAGFRVAPGELPDFLPALLELAAVTPAGARPCWPSTGRARARCGDDLEAGWRAPTPRS